MTGHGLLKTTRRPNRRFEFHKRGELFIRTDNETLSVVAMRVSQRRNQAGETKVEDEGFELLISFFVNRGLMPFSATARAFPSSSSPRRR
jgi:hypothetical protein